MVNLLLLPLAILFIVFIMYMIINNENWRWKIFAFIFVLISSMSGSLLADVFFNEGSWGWILLFGITALLMMFFLVGTYGWIEEKIDNYNRKKNENI